MAVLDVERRVDLVEEVEGRRVALLYREDDRERDDALLTATQLLHLLHLASARREGHLDSDARQIVLRLLRACDTSDTSSYSCTGTRTLLGRALTRVLLLLAVGLLCTYTYAHMRIRTHMLDAHVHSRTLTYTHVHTRNLMLSMHAQKVYWRSGVFHYQFGCPSRHQLLKYLREISSHCGVRIPNRLLLPRLERHKEFLDRLQRRKAFYCGASVSIERKQKAIIEERTSLPRLEELEYFA